MRNKALRRAAGVATMTMAISLLLALGASAAMADEQTVSDAVPSTLTNWSDTLSVPQFDPASGTLQSVEISFDATVDGSAGYESLDGAAATITLELTADVELQRPDTTVLSLLQPLVAQVDNADPFDGTIDFDGPSGGTFPGLTDTLNDTQLLTGAADLALFTGTGTVDLPVSATGMSTGSGAGNLLLQFTTNADARLTVTYTFEPPAGGEGGTPGYWKQRHHFGSWVGFSPDDSYATVFGVPYDKTLLQALKTGGGAEKALGRHSVAALLNSANDDVSFAFTAADVIALVQDAWATGDFEGAKSQLAAENELDCDLGRNPGPGGRSGGKRHQKK